MRGVWSAAYRYREIRDGHLIRVNFRRLIYSPNRSRREKSRGRGRSGHGTEHLETHLRSRIRARHDFLRWGKGKEKREGMKYGPLDNLEHSRGGGASRADPARASKGHHYFCRARRRWRDGATISKSLNYRRGRLLSKERHLICTRKCL